MIANAARLVPVLRQSGYPLDFSIESLDEIDRFLEEQTLGGQPRPGGLLAANLKSRIAELGAYVGEVIRRNRGGQWTTDLAGPGNSAAPVLQMPDGTILRPMDRILKRIHRGSEAGIAAWFWRPGQRSGNPHIATAPAVNRTTLRSSRQPPHRGGVNSAPSSEPADAKEVSARRRRIWWGVAAAVAAWMVMSFFGGMYRPLGIAAFVVGGMAALGLVGCSWLVALMHAWRNKPILVPLFILPMYFIRYSIRSLPETIPALILLGAGMATVTATFVFVYPAQLAGRVVGAILFHEGEPPQVAESQSDQAGVPSPDPRRSPPPIPVVPVPIDPFLMPPGVMPGPGPGFDPRMVPGGEFPTGRGGRGSMSYPESIDQALQELESSDPNVRRRALYYLLRPEHDHERIDVADRFLALLEHDLDPGLVDGLIAWGSESHFSGMCNVARRLENFQLRGLLRAIMRIDRETGVNVAVERFEDPRGRLYASSALREAGAAAEPGLLKLLAHSDADVREEASRVLQFVGGSESLEALNRQIAVESDRSVKRSMESALRFIQRRMARE